MPDQLLVRVEVCFTLAETHFQRRFARPTISWKLRGQKAGVAYLQGNELRFNAQLYQENREDFLRQTVAHEVAHLLVWQLYGKQAAPHGAQWAHLMHSLYGLEPRRCHHYAVTPRVSVRYLYRCQCLNDNQHAFSGQRHALVGKGRRYLCRRCQTVVRFTGTTERS